MYRKERWGRARAFLSIGIRRGSGGSDFEGGTGGGVGVEWEGGRGDSKAAGTTYGSEIVYNDTIKYIRCLVSP